MPSFADWPVKISWPRILSDPGGNGSLKRSSTQAGSSQGKVTMGFDIQLTIFRLPCLWLSSTRRSRWSTQLSTAVRDSEMSYPFPTLGVSSIYYSSKRCRNLPTIGTNDKLERSTDNTIMHDAVAGDLRKPNVQHSWHRTAGNTECVPPRQAPGGLESRPVSTSMLQVPWDMSATSRNVFAK